MAQLSSPARVAHRHYATLRHATLSPGDLTRPGARAAQPRRDGYLQPVPPRMAVLAHAKVQGAAARVSSTQAAYLDLACRSTGQDV